MKKTIIIILFLVSNIDVYAQYKGNCLVELLRIGEKIIEPVRKGICMFNSPIKYSHVFIYDVKFGEPDLSSKKIFAINEYNKSGYEIKSTAFTIGLIPMICDAGEVLYKTLTKYQNDTLKIEMTQYNPDGSLWRKSYYKYDSLRNLVEIYWIERDGLVVDKIQNKYNTFNQLIQDISLDSSDLVLSNTEYLYSNEKLISVSRFNNENGKKIFGSTMKCEYNLLGQLEKEIWFDEKGDLVSSVFYKYDVSSNIIGCYFYNKINELTRYYSIEYKCQ